MIDRLNKIFFHANILGIKSMEKISAFFVERQDLILILYIMKVLSQWLAYRPFDQRSTSVVYFTDLWEIFLEYFLLVKEQFRETKFLIDTIVPKVLEKEKRSEFETSSKKSNF